MVSPAVRQAPLASSTATRLRRVTALSVIQYAEAHHLQPLGGDHHGPDVIENIICVCPNHHALLDYFAISLSDIKIERHPEHSVGGVYLTYHNAQHQDRLSIRSA